MESFWGTSLKMALVLLSLFVLVQSPRISASGLLKHGKACGTYHISNLGDPRHELFFINGQLVERYFFYKILRDYHKRNCFITEYVRNQYYGLDLTLDKVPLQAGRRSLKTTAREGSSGLDYDKKSQNGMDKYAENSILKPKMLAMAVPAFFVLCCVLFCPCFQARKRDTGHAILTISMDSVSSLGMNPMFEKFPGAVPRECRPVLQDFQCHQCLLGLDLFI